jgi:uncharacterized membrane protein YcfT
MPVLIFIRDSQYGMPIVQSIHLTGLTILLAPVLVLNLRLAGVALKDSPLEWLARQLRPWTIAGLLVVVTSGLLIFLATPEKYLASNPFRVKMVTLALAMLFHHGVLRRFVATEHRPRSRAVTVLVSTISLTLWFTVGWAGRAIAFIP